MKSLVALLCTISAVVVSGTKINVELFRAAVKLSKIQRCRIKFFSYKCYSCISGNSTTCKESEVECLGDRCMTCSQFIDRKHKVLKSILKSCANETLCGAIGSIAIEKVMYRFYAKCCTGNLCNTDEYELPVEDPTPNGVKCPSAYCVGTLEECNSTKEMNCTGSMKNCFQFRGEVQHPGETWHNYSAKGCANNDACKYNFDSAVGLSERPRRELIC